MIKVAVMGFGTIGSGVVEVLSINKDSIAKRVGDTIEVKYVLDLRDFKGHPIQEKLVHDYQTIVEDKEVSIVVEAIGFSKFIDKSFVISSVFPLSLNSFMDIPRISCAL